MQKRFFVVLLLALCLTLCACDEIEANQDPTATTGETTIATGETETTNDINATEATRETDATQATQATESTTGVTEPTTGVTEPTTGVTEPEETEPVNTEPTATRPRNTEPVSTEATATTPKITIPAEIVVEPTTQKEPEEPVVPVATDAIPKATAPTTPEETESVIFATLGTAPVHIGPSSSAASPNGSRPGDDGAAGRPSTGTTKPGNGSISDSVEEDVIPPNFDEMIAPDGSDGNIGTTKPGQPSGDADAYPDAKEDISTNIPNPETAPMESRPNGSGMSSGLGTNDGSNTGSSASDESSITMTRPSAVNGFKPSYSVALPTMPN